jgi:hypothetical protein
MEAGNQLRNIAALFSILMPGLGQVYNRQFVRGIVFLIIEHYDNAFGHLNAAIHLDFNGFHQKAVEAIDFQNLMFYPGFYSYCVWDAWYFAKPGADKVKTAIPFIFGGFIGEFAAIYASRIPFPALTAGLAIIIPMLVALIMFRKQ